MTHGLGDNARHWLELVREGRSGSQTTRAPPSNVRKVEVRIGARQLGDVSMGRNFTAVKSPSYGQQVDS